MSDQSVRSTEAAADTVRKLACIIYLLLATKQPYVGVNRRTYEERIQRQRVRRLRHQAKELGFRLVETQKAA